MGTPKRVVFEHEVAGKPGLVVTDKDDGRGNELVCAPWGMGLETIGPMSHGVQVHTVEPRERPELPITKAKRSNKSHTEEPATYRDKLEL